MHFTFPDNNLVIQTANRHQKWIIPVMVFFFAPAIDAKGHLIRKNHELVVGFWSLGSIKVKVTPKIITGQGKIAKVHYSDSKLN